MVKVFNPLRFTINVASKGKKEHKPTSKNISRRVLAVVKLIDNELKAIINFNKETLYITEDNVLKDKQLIIPFTKDSFYLKNRKYVWSKTKDKNGHHICYIRDALETILSPNISNHYDALREDLLISGYIIKTNNEMHFKYEDLIAFHYSYEKYITNVTINDNKPLFSK